jgi:hypothetical protein
MTDVSLLQDVVLPRIDQNEILSDSNGMYAVVGDHEIVVARNYIQSNGEISVHAEAVHRAEDSNKTVLVYIDQDQDWYSYDPEDILVDNWRNQRNGSTMLNFHHGVGDRVDVGDQI